jgi:uncharacterized protein
MSTPSANPQHEPTMEEILASIRKIISEDQPEAAKPEPAKAAPLRAVPNEPAPVPAPAPAAPTAPVAAAPPAEADVLELTEELPEEEEPAPAPVVQAAPAPAPADDISFETIEVPPKAEDPADEDLDNGDLISDSTRSAVDRAFEGRERKPMNYLSGAGGSIEAIFVQAVQGAFNPTLTDWVDSHRAEIMDAMKPLIRAWMDEHLPPLIEAALAKEIARGAKTRKR